MPIKIIWWPESKSFCQWININTLKKFTQHGQVQVRYQKIRVKEKSHNHRTQQNQAIKGLQK